jgi:hypothetical protein
MRPLIIDDEARKRIGYAGRYANHNPLRIVDLKAMAGKGQDLGLDPHRIVFLDFGYKAVVSVQEEAGGWVRHLTIHLTNNAGRLPNPAAVKAIAHEFGLRNHTCHLIDKVINVKEPVVGNPS